MKAITLKVKANHNIIEDVNVAVKIDTTTSMWRNEVTLWFDNGDYCDVNIRNFWTTGRYLTTYENVYAVESFIEELKAGRISIEKAN